MIRSDLAIAFASLALVPALAATDATAATFCVSASSSGSCESTIQAAVDLAGPGDTISVRSGEYLASVSIPTGKDGLTIRGSGRNTVIDSKGTTVNSLDVASANVTLRDLRIRNSDAIGIMTTGAGTRILEVEISGASSRCVDATADGVTIERSKFYACGADNVRVVGNGAAILRNFFQGGDDGGVDVVGDAALVEGNQIIGAEDGQCISVDGNDAEVVGNRAKGCDGAGVEVDGDNPVVERNRVTASEGIEVDCTVCTTGIVLANQVTNTPDDAPGFDVNSNGLQIVRNRSTNTADEGLEVTGDGNSIVGNRVDFVVGDRGENCAQIDGNGNTVEKNQFRRCNDAGVQLTGDNNVYSGNRVREARRAGFEIQSGTGNSFDGNSVQSANGAAFEVETDALNTSFEGNQVGSDTRGELCDLGTGTSFGNDFDDVATTGSNCEF